MDEDSDGHAWGDLVSGTLVGEQAKTLASTPPSVVSAIDGIFVAFQTHSIVGMSDLHGLAQEEDFYVTLSEIQDSLRKLITPWSSSAGRLSKTR